AADRAEEEVVRVQEEAYSGNASGRVERHPVQAEEGTDSSGEKISEITVHAGGWRFHIVGDSVAIDNRPMCDEAEDGKYPEPVNVVVPADLIRFIAEFLGMKNK